MRTVLTHLTVLLCMFMQVWYGSTYRAGLVLCIPIAACDHDDDADGDHADSCCTHHAPIDRPATPGHHNHGCPCCVDTQMPDSTLPTAHLADLAAFSQAFDVAQFPVAILPGPEFGTRPTWLRARPHPPDSPACRASCGLATTRLLI